MAETDAIPADQRELQIKIRELEGELRAKELAADQSERGTISFNWGGVDLVALPIARESRSENEHYWRCDRLTFKCVGSRRSNQWYIRCRVMGIPLLRGQSPQACADSLHRALSNKRAECEMLLALEPQ